MAYVALYRQWRPKSFSDLVGQEHVSQTLAQAIETGRVGHAYLFSGPRGTGKTSTAKILAKALNCEAGPTPEPCGVCESCRRVNEGTSLDVFEIDAASNRGIDEIRELRETIQFAPVNGRYKVYIIDEVHMLTAEAFNALLKTLEEPPAQVVFILATTEIHKVPATIQSRCQRYDFKRIAAEVIAARLRYVADQSDIAAEDAALSLIAQGAAGGLRDALSTLDQCAALAESVVTEQLVRDILGLVGREHIEKSLRAIAAGDAPAALSVVAEVVERGRDLRQLTAELIRELRAAMVYQAAGEAAGREMTSTSSEMLAEEAALFPPEAFAPMIGRLNEVLGELRWTTEPRIAVETAFLSLCRPVAAGLETAAAETGPVGGTADEARLAHLEKQVAVLTAQLAARSAAVSSPSGAPAKHPLSRGRTVAAKPAPLAALSSRLAVTPEGQTLWQKLTESFQGDVKYKPLHSCLSGGKFGGMGDGVFQVLFSSPFLRTRLERDDYRQAIEARLAELSGQSWRFITAAGEKKLPDPPPPPPRRKDTGVKVDMASLPPEGRRSLEKAVEMFGDHFVPIEEAERQRAEAVAAAEKKTLSGAARRENHSAANRQNDVSVSAEDIDFPPLDDVSLPEDDDAPLPED